MSQKYYKVWNNELKKAVFADSLKDLILRGSYVLGIEKEQVSAFLEDGTELQNELLFLFQPAGTRIYLLTDRDERPWEARCKDCKRKVNGYKPEIEMKETFYRVWSNDYKKAVSASSLDDLIKKGSKKLRIRTQYVEAFLEDGTELDENNIFLSLPTGTKIYLLTDRDKRPWKDSYEDWQQKVLY